MCILCTYSVTTQSPDTIGVKLLEIIYVEYFNIWSTMDGNCLIISDTRIFAISDHSSLSINLTMLPLINIFIRIM